jgi:EAL domain-containing protein (putative c-di-GMP-specific phosphodiesterase class I)
VEFLMLVHADLSTACDLAGRICEALARPYVVPNRADATMSCSIGLAAYPEHGARQRLVGHAAAAMRQVKQAGGGDYMVFDPKMAVDLREQAELLADLRHAVARGQLELFYQPKVDARSLQITAAEALLRWHHPRRGMISPAVFIPLAERHGLISAIGNWVIDDATRQAAVWRAQGLRMRVAINISPYQMRQDDLVDRLKAALARHRLQPGRFTCEITESVAMEDTQVTQRSFERMRRAGLHVSIDDFGVGQASLSYLRRLPAAELKIDASFVQDLGQSEDARSIIDAVVKLAHALGLRVVAEGVETERQRDLLVELDCDELQGYLFAKPMAAEQLAVWAQLVDEPLPPQAVDFRESLFQETQSAEMWPLEPSPMPPTRARQPSSGRARASETAEFQQGDF